MWDFFSPTRMEISVSTVILQAVGCINVQPTDSIRQVQIVANLKQNQTRTRGRVGYRDLDDPSRMRVCKSFWLAKRCFSFLNTLPHLTYSNAGMICSVRSQPSRAERPAGDVQIDIHSDDLSSCTLVESSRVELCFLCASQWHLYRWLGPFPFLGLKGDDDFQSGCKLDMDFTASYSVAVRYIKKKLHTLVHLFYETEPYNIYSFTASSLVLKSTLPDHITYYTFAFYLSTAQVPVNEPLL